MPRIVVEIVSSREVSKPIVVMGGLVEGERRCARRGQSGTRPEGSCSISSFVVGERGISSRREKRSMTLVLGEEGRW